MAIVRSAFSPQCPLFAFVERSSAESSYHDTCCRFTLMYSLRSHAIYLLWDPLPPHILHGSMASGSNVFFISQPTSRQRVGYHTYCRCLEDDAHALSLMSGSSSPRCSGLVKEMVLCDTSRKAVLICFRLLSISLGVNARPCVGL